MARNLGPKEYEPWRRRCVITAGSILIVIGVLAVLIMLIPALANWKNQIPAKLALVFTALLPPLWFWVEYIYIWQKAPTDKRPDFEEFQYGQTVSLNLWLAFVGLIVALYFQ